MPYDLLVESRGKVVSVGFEKYAEALIRAVNDGWSEARSNMGDQEVVGRLRSSSMAKRENPVPVYEVGQFVLVRKRQLQPGEKKEVTRLWEGPYKVLSKESDVVYLLEREGGREDRVHVDRLKRWVSGARKKVSFAEAVVDEEEARQRAAEPRVADGPSTELEMEREGDEVSGDGDGEGTDNDEREQEEKLNEYEVQEILDKRVGKVSRITGRAQVEFLVRWKNWGAEHDSWERVENLDGCRDLVQAFERRERMRRAAERGERKLDVEGGR